MAQIFKSAVFQGVENTTTNVQVAVGVPPGGVIVFAGVYNAAGDTLTTITIGGNAMTQVGKVAVNGGTPFVYLYSYVGLAEGGYTIDVNRSGASGAFNVLAVCLYNTDTATGVYSSGTGAASGATVTASLDVNNGGWAIGIAATTGNPFPAAGASGPLYKMSTSSTKYMLVGGEQLSTGLITITARCNVDSTGGNNALVMGSVLPNTHITGNIANAPPPLHKA